MSNRILIVDDDHIFNNLLTDVFKQAGYEVRSANTADEALVMMEHEVFDLVVTDQRMPGTLGTQFVRKIMAAHKNLPVVMVSGYLENDTIRELIRDGVGGVFIKPLNIFQLLKRAAQLIERRDRLAAAPIVVANTRTSTPNPIAPTQVGPARSFPGRSPKAQLFVRRLQEVRDFSTNLLLVGTKGTDFELICRDVCELGSRQEELLVLTPAALASDGLPARLADVANRGASRITLAIAEPERLTPEASTTILSIARREGVFADVSTPVRFIFCMRDELDTLFDQGQIDENLYLFMGTMELRVPALGDVRDDIPIMAQMRLDEAETPGLRIDPAGAAYLKEREWPGDMLQLAKVVADAAGACHGRVLGERDLEDAYEGRITQRRKSTENLLQALTDARNDYVHAMHALCRGDMPRTATALGVPPDALRRIMDQADAR